MAGAFFMFGLSLYRITGESMSPALCKGDLLMLRKRTARTGDIVVVDHPRWGLTTKRIDADGRLRGDSPHSRSPAELGPYDPATLIGVAILIITPSGVRRPV